MTTYLKVEIDSVVYTDMTYCSVRSSIGTNNSASTFRLEFDNHNGRNKTKFSIADDVVIYSQKDTNPPTTKIFRGIVEKIDFKGKESVDEKIIISGRDYLAVLQNATV